MQQNESSQKKEGGCDTRTARMAPEGTVLSETGQAQDTHCVIACEALRGADERQSVHTGAPGERARGAATGAGVS